MKTEVVNKYKESYDVYIGRGSQWGNPFTHISGGKTRARFRVHTREQAIERYEAILRKNLELGKIDKEFFRPLVGKKLGCFCKPKSCHGDVLVKIIQELDLE